MLASFLVLASAETTELLDQAAEEVKNPILPTLNEMFWAAVFFILTGTDQCILLSGQLFRHRIE